MTAEANEKRFRIAFSFAGEKRDFVEKTARILALRFGEEKILYDKYHEAEFARFNLGIYLPKLYSEQSDLIVPVLCENYDQKRWTGWEWVHIYGLLTKADGRRVMPSRFGYATADGLSEAAGFIELDDKTPEQFARLILQRLAINENHSKGYYLEQVAVDLKLSDQAGYSGTLNPFSASTANFDELHKNLALELLLKAEPYLTELKSLLKCSDAAGIIEYFNSCPPEKIDELFRHSRKALNKVRFTNLQETDKQDVFEAVTVLYLLAAMRLVDVTQLKQGGHVVFVPRNEHVICAIIATALFGGCLKLLPDYDSQFPKPEYVFEVYAPAAGDYVTESFERAMYAAIYQNNRNVDVSILDSGALSDDERSDLVARLESIREIDEQNLCLVITAGISPDSAASVSNHFQVPTLFHSEETANALLGMTHHELASKLKEFWSQLKKLRNEHTSKTIDGAGQKTGDHFIITADQVNFAQAKGDKSSAQAGSG